MNSTQCPPGYYTDTYGSTNCTPCNPGFINIYYGATNAINCEACPLGKYSASAGTFECSKTPDGYFQNQSGQATIIPCPVGTANNKTGSDSSDACILCPTGKWQNQSGSSTCLDCQMGYYQNNNGQTQCLPCPSGTYNSIIGASFLSTSCIKCPAGKYSQTIAAISVSTCQVVPKGTYTDIPGSSIFKYCPQGTYQDKTNQIECLLCPIGTYNSFIGSINNTVCLPSMPGYYVNSSGSASSIPCPEGTWTNINGSIKCEACLPGKYTDKIASIKCLNCPEGTFSLGKGFANCESIGIPSVDFHDITSTSMNIIVNLNFTAQLPFQYSCIGVQCKIFLNNNLLYTDANANAMNANIKLMKVKLGIDVIKIVYNSGTTYSYETKNNVILSASLIIDRVDDLLINNIYANPSIYFPTLVLTSFSSNQMYNFLLMGLEPAVKYNFKIKFEIINQTYSFTPIQLGMMTTLPSVPTGPEQNLVKYFLGINIAEHANNEQANLQIHWEPPEIVFQHGPIIGYNVSYRQEERSYITYGANLIVVPSQDFSLLTNETTLILNNLNPDTNYTISVYPFTDQFGLILGPSATIFLKTQVSAPPKPPILNLLIRKSTNITVSWSSLTNETGQITKAWIIAEPYDDLTRTSMVVNIPLNNSELPPLPFPHAGIRGFFEAYNVTHLCDKHYFGFNFLSKFSGKICGGFCDVKCEYGTPMLDPTTILPTNDQNLTNDNYVMEFIDKDGNSSRRLVPYLTMKRRFILNTTNGGLNANGKIMLGDGKVNPNSLLNNTILDPNLAYRVRLIVFTSETLYAISDALELGPFQAPATSDISAAVYIGIAIAFCSIIVLIIGLILFRNKMKRRTEIIMMNDKTGNIIDESESIKSESIKYESINYSDINKNKNKVDYQEPLKYDMIDFSSVTNPLYRKLNTNNNTNNNYFDISLQNNNKNKNNNNNNAIHYFDVSDTQHQEEKDEEEEEEIFAVPSSFLKKEYKTQQNENEEEEIFAVPSQIYNTPTQVSNPLYFYGFDNIESNIENNIENNNIENINKKTGPVYFTSYLASQLKK